MTTNPLSGLRARVVAALQEVNHLRGLTVDPTVLAELASLQESLDEAAARFTDEGAVDRPEDIEMRLVAARRQLHALHNAVASSRRRAIGEHPGRLHS